MSGWLWSNGGQEVILNHQKWGGCNYLITSEIKEQPRELVPQERIDMVTRACCPLWGKIVWQLTSVLFKIYNQKGVRMVEQWQRRVSPIKSSSLLLSFWSWASVHIQNALDWIEDWVPRGNTFTAQHTQAVMLSQALLKGTTLEWLDIRERWVLIPFAAITYHNKLSRV